MLKNFLFVCAVLSTSVAAVTAEVDEVQSQIEARVGSCVDAAGRERLYRTSEGFHLVTYEQGVSVAEHQFTRHTTGKPGKYRLPRPPFPAQSRPIGEGIGLYEITFNVSGDTDTFTVVQSANSILDHSTEVYARRSWKGPLNTMITFALAYHKTGKTGTRIYGR